MTCVCTRHWFLHSVHQPHLLSLWKLTTCVVWEWSLESVCVKEKSVCVKEKSVCVEEKSVCVKEKSVCIKRRVFVSKKRVYVLKKRVYDTEQDRVKFVSHMLWAYHLASWFWSHPSASAQLHPSTVISNPSWVLTTSVAGLWNTSVKFEKKNHKKIQILLQCSICHNF